MHVTKNIGLRLIQLVLQVTITLLIARLTHAIGNGYFSLFITETSFLALFLGLSADSGIIYFTGKGQTNLSQITILVLSLLSLQLLIGLFLYYSVPLITGYHFFTLQQGAYNLGLGFIYVFSLIIINYYTAYNNSMGRFNNIITYNIVINVVLLLLLSTISYKLIPVLEMHLSLLNIARVYVYSSVLYASILIGYTYINNNERINFYDFSLLKNKAFRIYGINVFIGNILQFLAYRMDIWFVNYFDTKSDVGNYALASKIAQFWLILPQFLSALIFPVTASGNTLKYNFKKIAVYIILFNVFVALLSVIIYPLFIKYFMNYDFADSYKPFLWLLPGVIVFSLNTLVSAHIAGKGFVKINRQGSMLCFVIVLLLDIVLIPRYNINGAAIASTIGYIASTIFVLIKYFNINKDEGSLAGNVVS